MEKFASGINIPDPQHWLNRNRIRHLPNHMLEKEEILPGVIDHQLEVSLELVHAGILVRLQLLLDLHDVNGIVHCLIIPGFIKS